MKSFDTRAALALLALIGAISYQFFTFAILRDPEAQIPAWMSAVVMGCVGYYFGSKAANGVSAATDRGSTVTISPPPEEA